MNVCQVIGIDEAVRLVCKELEQFAAPGKLPDYREQYENLRRHGNIDIFFDMEEVGVAHFHFVTWDDVEVNAEFDFGELTREYLDKRVAEIRDKINEHRASRKPGSLILNASSAVH
jgi:hypothetical protein